MKILAISDEVVDRLYTPQVTINIPNIDLIIGCGDLPKYYLEFLSSTYNVRTVFVPGNHDDYTAEAHQFSDQGGDNIDGQVVLFRGLMIAGLGGSIRYSQTSPNQYSQAEMSFKARNLMLKVMIRKIITGRELDLFITHSPPFGVHDDQTDPAHIGFKVFNDFLKLVKPKFLLHGHTIFYNHNVKHHITLKQATQIVNVYPYRVLEIDPDRSGSIRT